MAWALTPLTEEQREIQRLAREFASKYPETSEQRTQRICDRIEQALAERRSLSAAAAS